MPAIPDDVMKAAWAVTQDGCQCPRCQPDAIARAILAERERCAKNAEDNAHADCEVAEVIAAAIRKGEA